MSASRLPGYFESGGYTERKKDQTKNKVIQNPGESCAEERQDGEQSKVSRRPFPRSTEAPPGCFAAR